MKQWMFLGLLTRERATISFFTNLLKPGFIVCY